MTVNKSGATSDVAASPVAPQMNGLQETGCQQLTHLYETKE